VTEAEVVVEAPVEVVTEAPVEVVAEAPVAAEPATEAPVVAEPATEAQVSSAQVASSYGKISDATSSTVTLNADGTVSSPSGTYSGVSAYNQATGHTDVDDPERLTQGGYLAGDKKTMFLEANKGDVIRGDVYITTMNAYGITSDDLAAYNITWIRD
jgi:hypothetical protein